MQKDIKEDYAVSFHPADGEIAEVKKWLLSERKKTGEGFFCNWDIIKSMFEKNQVAIIYYKNKTAGFATWRLTSDLTACIVIAEIAPEFRKNGLARQLTEQLIIFFKQKGIVVVHLQCAPHSSEPIWKRLGFCEFPDPPENYKFNYDADKQLYKIILEHYSVSSIQEAKESIELWNDEPYTTNSNRPTYTWNISFKPGTRELIAPIIHPAHYDWRIRWAVDGLTIKDTKVKYLGSEIDFNNFIVIKELPSP